MRVVRKEKVSTVDTRVHGKLTKKLNLLKRVISESEYRINFGSVMLKKRNGSFEIPDCQRCTDRCCVHKEPDEGILLSLQDIANLVDSGLREFIVGRYTFKKKNGKALPEIDKMPRLKKKKGNCVFYDEQSGLCTEYDRRPAVCRRFPYEVGYKRAKSGRIPYAKFVPGAPCPKIQIPIVNQNIRQIVVDTVDDENISLEDELLLPNHHKALRQIGFGPYLPSPQNCPS